MYVLMFLHVCCDFKNASSLKTAVFIKLIQMCAIVLLILKPYQQKAAESLSLVLPVLELVVFFNSKNKMWIISREHSDISLFPYKSDITARARQTHTSLHAHAVQRAERNERDVLMAFHLFMPRKWRGTVTFFWNSWQNKEPTLGKWLYLWFHADRCSYQERDGVMNLWQFKLLNDVIYGNILEHSL